MSEQNYANHGRIVVPFHVILFGMIVLTLVGSCVNLYRSLDDHSRLYSASLITVLSLSLLMLFFFARIFALKAQDRAIRAEENFRHYLLTGQPLDARLTIRQIIGLRFAADNEFPELAARAASQNMSEDDIKKAVRNWRADTYRV